MSRLADCFCEINTGLGDPFDSTLVVTQSHGMGRWLKVRLAGQSGIAANIDNMLPATLLWQLYQHLIPDARKLDASPFERNQLVWHILRILKEQPALSPSIQNYLSAPGDADLRRYQLANELALQIDEYLMYRPGMMLDWASDQSTPDVDPTGTAKWQAELWRLILADLPDHKLLHRAELHQLTLDRLAGQNVPLPWNRISVFGLSSMPPLQMQTFEALSDHVDIDIYFLNPSEHYWGDIVSTKDRARSIRERLAADGNLEDDDYLEIGNPLLSSFGKQGREYLELLLETNRLQTVDLFEPPQPDSRLGHVKGDIFDMTYGGAFEAHESPGKSPLEDPSIQIHSCHSRLREVEVLHDSLLDAFATLPGLQPSEVIVMAPDIDQYAPHIHAVFGDRFSYRLSDQKAIESSSLLTTFLWLLQLPATRFTASDLLDLLEAPAVMKKFELRSEDLELIHYWVHESGIRWELNGQEKADRWQVPAENQNTWQFGLERLTLGFAMAASDGIWDNKLPLEITPAQAPLLGTLSHIINLLSDYRQLIESPRPISAWQTLLTRLSSDFLSPDGNEILELDTLTRQLELLASRSAFAAYDENVSYQLVHHVMRDSLQDSGSSAGFVSGGLTFATLVPMRSVPYRVVCMLGINDGEFPRDTRPQSFDLIASGQHAKGDRSRKLDDRYLFLEAMLSAGNRLHISYLGKGSRDNKTRPPAGVLGELRDYLQTVFAQFKVFDHHLQPFNTDYYRGGEFQSFSDHWFDALTKPLVPLAGHKELPEDEELICTSTSTLVSFYRHPAKFFLQQRLDVYFDSEDESTTDIETFIPDGLLKYQIADDALTELVNDRSMDDFRDRVSLSGQLMTGDIGRAQLEDRIRLARGIHTEVSPHISGEATSVNEDVTVDGQRLTLTLDNLFADQVIHYRVGDLKSENLLAGWIQHLAINLVAPGTKSRFFYYSKDKVQQTLLAPVDPSNAEEQLARLLGYYNAGTLAPLFLPAGPGNQYAVELVNTDAASALDKTRQAWIKAQSDNPDRYWSRLFDSSTCFDADFVARSLMIWQPLQEAIADD